MNYTPEDIAQITFKAFDNELTAYACNPDALDDERTKNLTELTERLGRQMKTGTRTSIGSKIQYGSISAAVGTAVGGLTAILTGGDPAEGATLGFAQGLGLGTAFSVLKPYLENTVLKVAETARERLPTEELRAQIDALGIAFGEDYYPEDRARLRIIYWLSSKKSIIDHETCQQNPYLAIKGAAKYGITGGLIKAIASVGMPILASAGVGALTEVIDDRVQYLKDKKSMPELYDAMKLTHDQRKAIAGGLITKWYKEKLNPTDQNALYMKMVTKVVVADLFKDL